MVRTREARGPQVFARRHRHVSGAAPRPPRHRHGRERRGREVAPVAGDGGRAAAAAAAGRRSVGHRAAAAFAGGT